MIVQIPSLGIRNRRLQNNYCCASNGEPKNNTKWRFFERKKVLIALKSFFLVCKIIPRQSHISTVIIDVFESAEYLDINGSNITCKFLTFCELFSL